jgi:hypothetical protein
VTTDSTNATAPEGYTIITLPVQQAAQQAALSAAAGTASVSGAQRLFCTRLYNHFALDPQARPAVAHNTLWHAETVYQ